MYFEYHQCMECNFKEVRGFDEAEDRAFSVLVNFYILACLAMTSTHPRAASLRFCREETLEGPKMNIMVAMSHLNSQRLLGDSQHGKRQERMQCRPRPRDLWLFSSSIRLSWSGHGVVAIDDGFERAAG